MGGAFGRAVRQLCYRISRATRTAMEPAQNVVSLRHFDIHQRYELLAAVEIAVGQVALG